MDPENNIRTIHHVESLRRKASYYWPDRLYHTFKNGAVYDDHDFRPALNLRTLISLLSQKEKIRGDEEDQAVDDEPATSGRILRKRKRLEPIPGPSKRIKRRVGARENPSDEQDQIGEIDEDVVQRSKQIYPSFWKSPADVINEADQTEHTSFHPVYQFALHLRYNTTVDPSSEHYVDDKTAAKWGWLKEEQRLCSLLYDHQKNASLPRDIDIGRIFTTRYHGRLLALSGELLDLVFGSEEYSEKWLLLLPDIPWPDSFAEDVFEEQNMQRSGMHRDFITACAVLQSHQRTKLEASLQLHILPEDTYDPTCDLPFELRARFTLSLAIPEIYYPFKNTLSQGSLSGLEGLQRRLLCFTDNATKDQTHIINPVYNNAMEEATDVTIPFFLKMMRPAPPLAQDVNYESLQPDRLLATLMPFQRRTVAWMLEREDKRITSAGTVVPLDDLEAASSTGSWPLPLFWTQMEMGGQKFFFNRLTSALSPTRPGPHTALGGILAEEPGLGKTIECISLILLNPAPGRNPSNKRWDSKAQLHVKEIKTTLIVTPPALAAQWADELATHVPDLKVFVYQGWAKVKVPITEADVEAEREKRPSMAPRRQDNSKAKRNGKGKANALQGSDIVIGEIKSGNSDQIIDWSNFINQFDVCITTYNVLRSDMTVARAPPKRPRRQDVEYKVLRRPRSPLVMCEWYRVIMDEVQMMGTGKLEEMVSLIPRLSSWAVSGTPARAQVSDLISVLRFLRINDLVEPKRMWDRLLQSKFKDLFVTMFQKYSVRTLKSAVKGELTIPQQQRYLVGIELGRVERHVYDQALEEALAELGLDARGVAAYGGWQADASVLRNVLRRLRGICTHPQVGQLPKQGDKLNKTGALKSMADVLESMKDQNWKNTTEDRRAKVLALTRLAQLQQHRSDDLDRYQRALEHLLTAETEANQLIDDIKACIAQHNVKGDALKEEARALRDSRKMNTSKDQRSEKSTDKGKEREFERDSTSPDLDLDLEDEEDIEDRGLPKTPAGEDHRVKRAALLARLRECLMVLHRVKFLQGDVYHVLGSSYSEKEDAAYGYAESLRKELLKSTEESANKAMRRLSVTWTEKRVTQRMLQIPLPFMEGGGIKSAHLFEEANEIIEDVLNEQSALLWQWRTKIVGLLTQKLNSAGEQADGEEYARTLDTQGEAEVYLQAYTALLADRREAIAAERTLLAAHEGREKKMRKTKAATRTKFQTLEKLDTANDVEVLPEHQVLHAQLLEQRKELQLSERALKSVMVDLSAVAARIPKESDPEKIIAKDGATRLRTLIASLQELTDKLDADLAVLRKVFNDRIVYFRQLQEISDTVAEVQLEGPLVDAMQSIRLDNANLEAKIKTGRARQRYLEHLAEDGSRVDNDDAVCILCQCEFLRGFITQCAHIFCEGCMKAWIARGQGRACPVCRSPIDPRQSQRFTVQGDQDQPPPQRPVLNSKGEPVPTSRREIHYNMINPTLFADTQTMESSGSYGSKIQTLVRHLLHIQLVDPGAKSIVFSAWADSLTIIEHALQSNGIPCIRLDQNQGRGKDGGAKRFRVDPYFQVLLLHGERDNAGLNVTCASRVFLLESVVNHGFEVQAIARIDRMGQTRATEVFCYYAEDTVEQSILDLAARQGLSLYTKDNFAGSVNVTSFAMDSQKKLVDLPTNSSKKKQPAQKGDFIFKVDDMLAILFPHMYEDIEYLLPPDARDEEATCSVNGQPGPVRPPARRVHMNAEAGPSRLPAFVGIYL
ncbi:SNF2 family N-terminal domain-containing protein [Boletus edulis BED1]|uniref:SNF2 family N-terminal domain-containing protein n=1 Tax=Boletus edulis BED1 TaxID=1328754 RepID=A0AAD4GEX8_BOLED|nr:SNF2 family N-terminal domain-containing protein [Boletus edulis BED1]